MDILQPGTRSHPLIGDAFETILQAGEQVALLRRFGGEADMARFGDQGGGEPRSAYQSRSAEAGTGTQDGNAEFAAGQIGCGRVADKLTVLLRQQRNGPGHSFEIVDQAHPLGGELIFQPVLGDLPAAIGEPDRPVDDRPCHGQADCFCPARPDVPNIGIDRRFESRKVGTLRGPFRPVARRAPTHQGEAGIGAADVADQAKPGVHGCDCAPERERSQVIPLAGRLQMRLQLSGCALRWGVRFERGASRFPDAYRYTLNPLPASVDSRSTVNRIRRDSN